ncbi:MAG: TRAP transporter small permease subunit [Burkholderiales bacterium]
MNVAISLLAALRGVVRWLSAALLAALIVVPLAQVVMRGVFGAPMSGAEELTRWFLICLCFLAASYVTVEGGQVRMEEFQALLPPRPRWVLQLVIEASGVVLFGLLAVACVASIRAQIGTTTATLEMPMWLFMAPLAVGGTLLSLETAIVFARTLSRGRADDKQTTLT